MIMHEGATIAALESRIKRVEDMLAAVVVACGPQVRITRDMLDEIRGGTLTTWHDEGTDEMVFEVKPL